LLIHAAKADTASVGGFSEAPLLQTPASISVYTQQQMQDQGIRSTTDVVRFDASLNEDYNAIGYAEQFSIRGFRLDNFSSYRKDGLPISSDASIPLENKERIEVLKGLAGLQAGQRPAASSITSPSDRLQYVAPPSAQASAGRCTAPPTWADSPTTSSLDTASMPLPKNCVPT
jgi:outer membrane receptor protein involved in Fe transport